MNCAVSADSGRRSWGKRSLASQLASTPVGGIPHDVFDARNLPHSEGFAVWRQSVLPLFEPELDGTPPQQFFARVEGFNLRRLVFCLSEFSAQRYLRRRGHCAGEASDSVLIQLYLSGGYVGHNANRPVRVGPGDVSLLDLAHSLETRAEASSALSLVVPRELLSAFMGTDYPIPGTVISGSSVLGGILAHHLTTVWHALHSAHAGEEDGISKTLLGAVAGAFAGQNADEACAPALRTAAIDTICAYIDRNLASEELTTEHLCRQFACSRARLYRLFEPLGGVAGYIRQARLERCRRELADPQLRSRSVTDVAMRWGFSSQSHFCRLFRRTFGLTPSDVLQKGRNACRAMPRSAPSDRPALHDWLRQL